MKPSIRLAVAVFAGLCAEFLTTQIAGIIPLFAEQNSQVSICDNITRGFCAVDFFRITPGGVVGIIIGYAVCFRIFGILAPIKTILIYAASSTIMWGVASAAVVTNMDPDFWLATLIVVVILGICTLMMLRAGTSVRPSRKFAMLVLTGVVLGYEWPWFPKAAALFGIEVLAVSVAGTAVYFGGKYVLNALEKKR